MNSTSASNVLKHTPGPRVLFACTSDRWNRMTADAKGLDRIAIDTEAARGRNVHDPDAHLCSMQLEQQRAGYVQAQIQTNIYGFCVRDTMNDGLGVLHSARGSGTAAEAIGFARNWHALAPDRHEVIVGYIDESRRGEFEAALAADERMHAVNDEQRAILAHALGIGRSGREYRNHFVTGPGSDDYPHCEALVAAGLMTKRSGNPLSGGDPVYTVTEAGKAVARAEGRA